MQGILGSGFALAVGCGSSDANQNPLGGNTPAGGAGGMGGAGGINSGMGMGGDSCADGAACPEGQVCAPRDEVCRPDCRVDGHQCPDMAPNCNQDTGLCAPNR